MFRAFVLLMIVWLAFCGGLSIGTNQHLIDEPFRQRILFDPTPFDQSQPLQFKDFCGGTWT